MNLRGGHVSEFKGWTCESRGGRVSEGVDVCVKGWT